MKRLSRFDDFEDFIANIRTTVLDQHDTEVKYFDIYINEARFGLSVIENDLGRLDNEAEVMEIGAGIMLLSGYLAYKGFRVHALEPIEKGFSLLGVLQKTVLGYYKQNGICLDIIKSTIENISNKESFDYVFSINVFEHIGNIELGLLNSYVSLRNGATLRIYCPNYLFPYEPHFNIPIMINKRLTEYVFYSRIFNSSLVPHAKEVWSGLNWINIFRIRNFFRNRLGREPDFNKMATFQIARRMLKDSYFIKRRSGFASVFFRIIDRFGLLALFKLTPVIFSPVMDFKIRRSASDPQLCETRLISVTAIVLSFLVV